jgi:hypothetical protein
VMMPPHLASSVKPGGYGVILLIGAGGAQHEIAGEWEWKTTRCSAFHEIVSNSLNHIAPIQKGEHQLCTHEQ